MTNIWDISHRQRGHLLHSSLSLRNQRAPVQQKGTSFLSGDRGDCARLDTRLKDGWRTGEERKSPHSLNVGRVHGEQACSYTTGKGSYQNVSCKQQKHQGVRVCVCVCVDQLQKQKWKRVMCNIQVLFRKLILQTQESELFLSGLRGGNWGL